MAKVLYVCSRSAVPRHVANDLVKNILHAIKPENIETDYREKTVIGGNYFYLIWPYSETFSATTGQSVLLGALFEPESVPWDTPGKTCPDGSYAIIRGNDDVVELLVDEVGSRTIWYYHDTDVFIAATSQRAIIQTLGSFEFDPRVVPWMMSTGTLGPDLAWDRRIRRVAVGSAVLLNKRDWSLRQIDLGPRHFAVSPRSHAEHKKKLSAEIEATISTVARLALDRTVLPLSGGYDSRGILCYLKRILGEKASSIRTITWGARDALEQRGSDADVARRLASRLKVPHAYHHTDDPDEPIGTIFDRFLRNSEGRIDHVSGYMDGMAIWRTLHDDRIDCIIRGDEGFGWLEVSSERDVRLSVGCGLCSDFANLSDVQRRFALPPQSLGPALARESGETLAAWRDRLYHYYRIPTVLAALSDAKLGYLEIVNPLLSRRIIRAVRQLPDDLRTNKALFRELVMDISPRVEIASREAHPDLPDILKRENIVVTIRKEIDKESSKRLLGKELCEHIASRIANSGKTPLTIREILKSVLRRILPSRMKSFIRGRVVQNLDYNLVAFRLYIILRMHEILESDTRVGAGNDTRLHRA